MLSRVNYLSNESLINSDVILKEKDEFGISFGSVDTFENLQYFINLYEDKVCVMNDDANDLSMYVMAYINDKKRNCSLLSATSVDFDRWRKQGIKITHFSNSDCVKMIDKRLGIKRNKKEYEEIDQRFSVGKYSEKNP
jgi:hypothetical protein